MRLYIDSYEKDPSKIYEDPQVGLIVVLSVPFCSACHKTETSVGPDSYDQKNWYRFINVPNIPVDLERRLYEKPIPEVGKAETRMALQGL